MIFWLYLPGPLVSVWQSVERELAWLLVCGYETALQVWLAWA